MTTEIEPTKETTPASSESPKPGAPIWITGTDRASTKDGFFKSLVPKITPWIEPKLEGKN